MGENTQIEQEGNSIEILAKDSNESRATIQRLIRLTELSDVLKRKVNDGVIGIQAGIELSYLNQNVNNISRMIMWKAAVYCKI